VKDVVVILTGFVLIAIQAVLHQWVPASFFTPDLVLPFVLYLGIIDFGAARGTALAFVLGYILDASSGSAVGVHLFVMPATYLLFRFWYHKLLFTGTVFQIAMTFAASITMNLMIVGMRTLFERSILSWTMIIWTLLFHALSTAICSPAIFWLGSKLIPESPKRKEEKVVV
jgi:rod shape-determining protein MreD